MRKYVLTQIVALVVSANPCGADLPKHANLHPLSLQPIGETSDLNLNVEIKIPEGQTLHAVGLDPLLAIYEKVNGTWQKTGEIEMNGINSILNSSTIHLHEHRGLQTKSGPIAIDSTLFHCATKGGFCVIDSFQGIVERRPGLKDNHVTVTLTGTDAKKLFRKR